MSGEENKVEETIKYEDFEKLDIRIGTIEKAEPLKDSDKLLKLAVSFGEEKRQIVAGIAEFYSPEELEGKQCPFLFNLEPKKLRGEESQGMLMAIDPSGDKKECCLLHPDKKVSDGSKIV